MADLARHLQEVGELLRRQYGLNGLMLPTADQAAERWRMIERAARERRRAVQRQNGWRFRRALAAARRHR
jgi:hypothetical protein